MKNSSENFINAILNEIEVSPKKVIELADKYDWKIYGVKITGLYSYFYLHEIVIGFFNHGRFQGIHSFEPAESLEDLKDSDDFYESFEIKGKRIVGIPTKQLDNI